MSDAATHPLATGGPLFAATAAIRARLAEVFPPARFHHGMLTAVPTREEWDNLVRRTPFVGVTWLGAAPMVENGAQLRMVSTWRVVLVNSHMDVARRFTGDNIAPGQFALAQVAALALHNLRPPADVSDIDGYGSLTVTEMLPLSAEWAKAAEAIVGLTVASQFALVGSAADLPALLRLRGGWSFDGYDDTAAAADQDFTGDPP